MSNTTARRALGIANIGIGLGEIAAAEWINDKLGTHASRLTRVVGAHKLATGIGTLAMEKSQLPSFARIASNALHVGLMITAAAMVKSKYRPIVFGVLGGVVALAAVDAVFSAKSIREIRAQHRLDRLAGLDARDMASRHSHPF
jgi:hypothetical protein